MHAHGSFRSRHLHRQLRSHTLRVQSFANILSVRGTYCKLGVLEHMLAAYEQGCTDGSTEIEERLPGSLAITATWKLFLSLSTFCFIVCNLLLECILCLKCLLED